MTSQRVLLLGATGETGGSILHGLLEYGTFEVTALVRPSSSEKPEVKGLAEKGVRVSIADITGPVENLIPLLSGVDVVISAIDGMSQLAQMNLASAAKSAGTKRFVPCFFATVCPAGGVMMLRDEKEQVIQHVKKLFLPYTVIDVGYWYQLSFPRLPSGRVDYASLPQMRIPIHGDGEARNLLTDLRDIGKFVARIIDDKTTLNKSVFCYGDVLTENQIFGLMEEISGEKLEREVVSVAEMETQVAHATEKFDTEPENVRNRIMIYTAQYAYSKYVRKDNTPEYASYLGYLDARELYPDFKPKTFREFVVDLLDGRVVRPYAKALAH